MRLDHQHPALRCLFCGWIHAGINPSSPQAAITLRTCGCGVPVGAMEPVSWGLMPMGAVVTGIVMASALTDAEMREDREGWHHRHWLPSKPSVERAISDVVGGIVSADADLSTDVNLRAMASDPLRAFGTRDRAVPVEHVIENLDALIAENALAWDVERNLAQAWAERHRHRRSGGQPTAEEPPP